MKVSQVKTPIVRKSIKRAQQIVKNSQPQHKGGYVPYGNGYVFVAGGEAVDKKVAEANRKLDKKLGIESPIVNKPVAKAQQIAKNIQSEHKGGYVPYGNGYVFVAGGEAVDKKVAEANKKLMQ